MGVLTVTPRARLSDPTPVTTPVNVYVTGTAPTGVATSQPNPKRASRKDFPDAFSLMSVIPPASFARRPRGPRRGFPAGPVGGAFLGCLLPGGRLLGLRRAGDLRERIEHDLPAQSIEVHVAG